MRIVIDPEFERVPVGRVTPASAAVTSLFFALAHPEWLPALLTGLAWAWLLWKSKSLWPASPATCRRTWHWGFMCS